MAYHSTARKALSEAVAAPLTRRVELVSNRLAALSPFPPFNVGCSNPRSLDHMVTAILFVDELIRAENGQEGSVA